MRNKIYGFSTKAQHHNINQDAVLLKTFNGISVLLVCDGVGSVLYSEKISKFCIDFFNSNINELKNINIKNSIKDWFQQKMFLLNEQLLIFLNEKKLSFELACTLNLCIIYNNQLYCFNIGDSRAYVYKQKNNTIVQITIDQTLENFLKDNNIQKYKDKQYLKALVHYVSYKLDESKIKFDFFKYDLEENDLVICCSDGLYNFCDFNLIQNQIDAKKVVKLLVQSAINNKSNDDISVGVFVCY